jgi:hypothetical protein
MAYLWLMKEELFKLMFGEFTTAQLLGYLWFFLIGYIIYGLSEVTGRDIDNPKTPREWSWKFWFLDNWRRYLTTILCTYVFFRFYNEISGHPFGIFDALVLGITGDSVSVIIKKRIKSLDMNREEIMKTIQRDKNNSEEKTE